MAADTRGWLSILSTDTGGELPTSTDDTASTPCIHSGPVQERMRDSAGEEGLQKRASPSGNEKRRDEDSCCDESPCSQASVESVDCLRSRNFFRFPGLSPFSTQGTQGKQSESDSNEAALSIGVPNFFMFLMRIGATVTGQDQETATPIPPSLLTSLPSDETWPSVSQHSGDRTAEEKRVGTFETPSVFPSKKDFGGEDGLTAALKDVSIPAESCPSVSSHVTGKEAGGSEKSVVAVLRSSSVSAAVTEWVMSLCTTDVGAPLAVPFVTEEAAKLLWKSACSLIANPIVAFYCQCYALASLGAVVFTTSIVHWWRPQLGIRRTIDVTAVVIVASIHWLAALFLTDVTFQAVYFLITWTGVTCYFGGCILAARGRSMPGAWCHVGLHSICTIGNLCLYMYLALVAEDSIEKEELVQLVSEQLRGKSLPSR